MPTTMINTLDICNAMTGVPFRLIFLPRGVKSPHHADPHAATGARVEVYDRRHAHTDDGQYVSNYYAEDLLCTWTGLDLAGGVPDWRIDARTMCLVRTWLRHVTD